MLTVSTDKARPVINIIHHCMQSGTYRMQNPEKMFEQVLTMLRKNSAAVEWLTDKGKNDVEDVPEYKDFVDALEQGMRNVALSGSRLFKKNSIATQTNWQGVDKWRKCAVVLFILRYVCVLMNRSMCPYVLKRVSICIKATVLMFIRLCPHVFEHMSLCIEACVLMHQSNCPHAL